MQRLEDGQHSSGKDIIWVTSVVRIGRRGKRKEGGKRGAKEQGMGGRR